MPHVDKPATMSEFPVKEFSKGLNVGFLEPLPAGCPPDNAHEGACANVFRLTVGPNPTLDDFASKAALKEPMPPRLDPCRWASCSLFPSPDVVQKKRNTFKRLKAFKYAARLNISAGSGKLIRDETHIDFWVYDTFDPGQAIVSVELLQDA
jgi:hypothetical protein